MIFDGMKFRQTKKIVVLPMEHWTDKIYVGFGRICNPDKTNAVKTNCRWAETDYPVYAIPITGEHGRTNLLYGDDGYIYLCYDRQVYIRKSKKENK